jgi:VCBS repeat-containing protein
MRRKSIRWAAVCAVVAAASCAPTVHGATYYTDKIYSTPDYTQTDTAYGGFPDGSGEAHGGVFCGPTSTSNAVMWLDDHGWPNLVPNTSDRKKDQHDLIATIASDGYMDAYDYDGVDPTRLANGLAKYIHDRGYQYSRFQWEGRRDVPSWVDTGVNIPDLNWMRAGIEGPCTVQLWSVGWYGYNAATDNYTRNGGHWVTMVGHGYNGSTYDPNYFVIHDPSPRCGTSFANNYVLPVRLESGTIGSEDITGQYKLTGWPINPVGDCAILDGVFVVEMLPVNYAPVGVADAYGGSEDVPVVVSISNGVLANDTDQDNDPLTTSLVSGPGHGTLTLLANGSLTYAPVANYHGTDSFTYKAYDGKAYSNVTTVTLSVASVNDIPVATGETYQILKGEQRVVYSWEGLLVNDTDADNTDGDPTNDTTLSAVLGASTSHGTLSLYGNGAFMYTPLVDFVGTDSFTYRAYDGQVYSDMTAVLLNVSMPIQVPGDATGDGLVNQADAAVLATHWGHGGETWSTGDFNGDGVVGPADASILAANWGASAGEAGGTSVPEPSSLVLLVLAAVAAVCRRGRRDFGRRTV